MAKIIVFNNDSDRIETYYREENEPMPYNTNNTLRVREFRGSSRSNVLWTTKRTMQSWNSQRYIFGSPIPVGFAFKRPYEGGHGNLSNNSLSIQRKEISSKFIKYYKYNNFKYLTQKQVRYYFFVFLIDIYILF